MLSASSLQDAKNLPHAMCNRFFQLVFYSIRLRIMGIHRSMLSGSFLGFPSQNFLHSPMKPRRTLGIARSLVPAP